MTSCQFESFLARLYTDREYLDKFLNDPHLLLDQYLLNTEEREALINIDKAGLILSVKSFACKRKQKTN